MSDIPVVVPCLCPATPHADGDTVFLAPAISLAGGMAAQGAFLAAEGDAVRLQELLAGVYLRHGVTGWTRLDSLGRPVPPTPDNLAAGLPYGKGGRTVAEKADELYAEDITAPLLERLSSLSRTGSMADTTSPASTQTPTPSAPSSPAASADTTPSTD